jgi:hypothetical protein
MPPGEWDRLVRWAADFRARTVGSIYAVKAGDFIKIGFTKGDVWERLAQLQTGCPMELQLLGTGPGGRLMEGRIHAILKDYRAHGEWFRDEPIVREIFTNISTARIWE